MTKHRYSKRRIEVAYWTAKDDREGSCSPCGRAILYVSENYDLDKIFDLKRFKRRNGDSRIYDISER